jgi:hypothetical protein
MAVIISTANQELLCVSHGNRPLKIGLLQHLLKAAQIPEFDLG